MLKIKDSLEYYIQGNDMASSSSKYTMWNYCATMNIFFVSVWHRIIGFCMLYDKMLCISTLFNPQNAVNVVSYIYGKCD